MLEFIFRPIQMASKILAEFLGFKWSEPNVSGVQAIVWRQEWEKSGKPALKQKLIKYNTEDCEGLQRVTDFVVNLSIPYEASMNPDTPDIVHTESLPRNDFFKFRKIEFCLPEFEKLNQAAYWDYQREKILVKSSNRLKNIEKKRHKQKFIRPRINKSIYWPAPSYCPKCSGTKIYKHWAIKQNRSRCKVYFFRHQKMGRKISIFITIDAHECGAVLQNSEREWGSEKCRPEPSGLIGICKH